MLGRTLVAALVCSAALGCESVLEPARPIGAYMLAPGAAAPVLENPSVRIRIIADTLWLHRDGTARRVTTEERDYLAASVRDTTVVFDSPYRYRVRGARVELEYVCPPNALCTPPPHLWGRTTRDGLELQSAFDPRPTLRYQRIRS